MCNTRLCYALIVWLSICGHLCYSKTTYGLSSRERQETIYYHNIYRYMITVGSVKNQPMSSDMKLMRWNQSLAMSLETISNGCVLMSYKGSCPPISVYLIKRQQFEILRVVRSWFDLNKHYNYTRDTCRIVSCLSYKLIVNSDTSAVGCMKRRIGRHEYFICRYSERTQGRPYKAGEPCISCSKTHDSCFKKSFCIKREECKNQYCGPLLTKPEEYSMQADQPQFCLLSSVKCDIKFYRHMCPRICSPSRSSFRIEETTTTKAIYFKDNDVCKLVKVDCSITFFKILCRNSCESVLCRDPNMDCKNVFYSQCQKCRAMNGKMSDSKITTTTLLPSIENAIGLNDPKCQDLLHDNYCTDRGEMCSYPTYQAWMKKFCCNTCKILDMCLDYLDLKNPGKCSDIQSSGRCDSLWSHTYCRKTCEKC